jgi:hypothetical protein
MPINRASTVLPLPGTASQGIRRGYRPALFRLIIGGRSSPFAKESFTGAFHGYGRKGPAFAGRRDGDGSSPANPCLRGR